MDFHNLTAHGTSLPFVPHDFAQEYTTFNSERLSAIVLTLNEHMPSVCDALQAAPTPHSHIVCWSYLKPESDKVAQHTLLTMTPTNAELQRASVAAHILSAKENATDFLGCTWLTRFSEDYWSAVLIDPGSVYTVIRFQLDEENGIDDVRCVRSRLPYHLSATWHSLMYAQHIDCGAADKLPPQLI